jgi:hypothetical protein
MCEIPGEYAGGCAWGSQNGFDWLPFNPIFDIRFRTFVGPAVPEPAAVVLAILGVFALAATSPRQLS